jgi:hypothetical protein
MRLVDGLEGDTRVRTKKSKPRLMDVERSRDVPSACHTPLATEPAQSLPQHSITDPPALFLPYPEPIR